jgi:hypothetical protein
MLCAILVASILWFVPFNDLGTDSYSGYQGGLYEDGSNVIPSDHQAAGLRRAAFITPRDGNGVPSPSGKVVFLGSRW